MKIFVDKKEFEGIQRKNKFFETLLAGETDGILISDKSQRIIEANDTFCGYLCQLRQEVIDTKLSIWLEKLDPRAPLQWRQLEEQVRLKNFCFDMEFQSMGEEGIKYYSVNASLIEEVADENKGTILSTWRDITERKKTEEALQEGEKKYRRILHTAMDGFWRVDSLGRILEVNPASCEISGYTAEEMLQMYVPDIEALESSEEVRQHIEELIRLGKGRFESKHRCKDGRIIDTEMSVAFSTTSNQLYVFIRDISKRKEREKALQKSEEQLREANATKDKFFSIMAHDLRGPLSALLAGFQMLSLAIEEKDSPQIEFIGKELHNNTQQIFNPALPKSRSRPEFL